MSKTASGTELMDCPHCGEPAEVDWYQRYQNITSETLDRAIAIYCTSCAAQMSACVNDHPDLTPEAIMECLTGMWNHRASDAANASNLKAPTSKTQTPTYEAHSI